MTPTEPSPPEIDLAEHLRIAWGGDPWGREAQVDRRNARLTLQAERAAQEIERRDGVRGHPRPRSWRRPRSWF